MSFSKRPTFYSKHGSPIRAGGLLFYLKYQGETYIMVQEVKKHKNSNEYIWTDIGGKTDIDDLTLDDTICREVLEETNLKLFEYKNNYPYNLLSQVNKLKKYIKNHKKHVILLPNSKYIVYLIEFKYDFFNPKIFKSIKKNHNSKFNNNINSKTNEGQI